MPVEDDDGWGGGDETDGWGTASAAKSAQKNPSLDAMQSGDSWRFVAPTTAQLRVGKLLVDQIADQISHRETKTITAEKSEIHAALCYARCRRRRYDSVVVTVFLHAVVVDQHRRRVYTARGSGGVRLRTSRTVVDATTTQAPSLPTTPSLPANKAV